MRKLFVCIVFSVFLFHSFGQNAALTSLYPNSRGWINKYEDLFIKGNISFTQYVKIPSLVEKTIALERVYLPESYPTLIYATRISDQYWTKKDKSKLLLFEYFLNAFIEKKGLPKNDLDDFINSLSVFYHADTTKLFSKLLKIDFLELKIAHKIQIRRNWLRNPMWYRSEANALLMNEITQFKGFLESGVEFSKELADTLENSIISFVVKESRKDFIINCKEKELVDFYLASSRLSKKNKNDWRKKLENSDTNHYSNGSIKKGEQTTSAFDLCEDNLTKWQNEAGFKWSRIKHRNLYKFKIEVVETKEFFSLCKKSFKTDLSSEERIKVKNQSIDLLMCIPSTIIFIIPGGSIILPFALKYIPVLCPSAFKDNSLKVH